MENCLYLWELLSSLRKLSYLALSLCVMGSQGLDDTDKHKLTSIITACQSLRALEICNDDHFGRACMPCRGVRPKDLLFSHFPSIMQCRMVNFPYSVLNSATSSCTHLKYFYEDLSEFQDEHRLAPLSGDCCLQELHISSYTGVSDGWAYTLSIHCKLESVFCG